MNKNILKNYMLSFPGSFVGFFEALADVLNTLGTEWVDAGEKSWGQAFIDCSVRCNDVSVIFTKLQDEFDKKNSETNPRVLIDQHLEKIKNSTK